jgi:mono/diheme cytochrome c family protein
VSLPLILGLGVAGLALLAFFGGMLWIMLRRRPERPPEIPAGMRPGPSDEVLERSMFERLLGWNVLFVLFFSAWLPVLWLREPSQNVADEQDLVNRGVERGHRWFLPSSEENPTGYGCATCHGLNAEGGTTRFTTATGEFVPNYPVPPLRNVCGGPNTGHPQIKSIDDIRNTIMQGREGTPMPSWSVQFAGPMNDQQIEDLIRYLVSIQQGVPDDQNVCTNPAAAAAAASPQADASPSPTEGEASPGAEESPAGSPSPSPTG